MNNASKLSGSRPSKRSAFFVSADAAAGAGAVAIALLIGLHSWPAYAGELRDGDSGRHEETGADTQPLPTPSGLSSFGRRWLSPDKFSASAGTSAWSGDFGSSSTTTISAALLSGSYAIGDLRISATLPYTRITTAGDVFLGLGATPLIVRPQSGVRKRVNEGVGDLTFNASYVLHPSSHPGFVIQLLGAVKAPTASSSSRVSTGKTDVSFGAEASKPFGRLVPFASIVYRDFGSSAAYRLRDGTATSIGASYVVSSRWVTNLSYDYARSASRFVSDSHELVSSLSYKFQKTGVRLSAYASAGLSSGAPSVAGGLSLGKAF